ncbi:MAG: nucleotide-diphospho-sugar transferase [Aureispira sp.]|nr:nucleotide-diphospho-sugar transferase [Aureispira sp.]
MSDCPILILVFNRPEETQQVFNRLRQIKPKQLFVGADGYRMHKEGEKDKVQAVRNIFLEQIDWDCELKTLFREENLGCKRAVSGAISWFFEQVEYGVILEDDCIPHPDFIPFCADLLEHYKNQEEIMHIGGFNNLSSRNKSQHDYFFTHYSIVWGWATWRRAWKKLDLSLSSLSHIKQNQHLLDKTFPNKYSRPYILEKWEKTATGELDSWAYAWSFSIATHEGLCILPQQNLIENIGFGEEATHTQSETNLNTKYSDLRVTFPLRHIAIDNTNLNDLVDPKMDLNLFYASQKSKFGLWLRYWMPSKLLQTIKKLFNR